MIDGFKAKYGLPVNELNPDAGSADELEAIKANKGNAGPQAPDVIDVGLSFGPTAKSDGLMQPYKVATWERSPTAPRTPTVHGTAIIYGVLGFEVNKDAIKNVPADWSDLAKPEYRNAVALAGDPRSSYQAIQGVYAAGLSAAKGDASKAAEAGLAFFADLNKKGNFVPVIGKAASVAQGATPIVIRWDYNALADRDTFKGNPRSTSWCRRPASSRASTCRASAPSRRTRTRPSCGWKYLYSDEGQIGMLNGYCHPIRYNDLVRPARFRADPRQAAAGRRLRQATFPTLAEQDAAKEVITKKWDSVVGANVSSSMPVQAAASARSGRRAARLAPGGGTRRRRGTAVS